MDRKTEKVVKQHVNHACAKILSCKIFYLIICNQDLFLRSPIPKSL